MVVHPADYQWSSYRCNAYGNNDDLVTAHDVYLTMDPEKASRQIAYRNLFESALPKKLLHEIRNAANFSMPLGENRFKQQIEQTLNRSLGYAKRGRPVSENTR